MKLEVVVIPVADVDRAKAFNERLGGDSTRDFPLKTGCESSITPPGSPASTQFGAKLTSAGPGSAQNLYLVVFDVEARATSSPRVGVEVSHVFHPGSAGRSVPAATLQRSIRGRAPDHADLRVFCTFSDPDGNRWPLQEVTTRGCRGASTLPQLVRLGKRPMAGGPARGDRARRAREANGAGDVNWPDWYAAYMVAEQAGTELPT